MRLTESDLRFVVETVVTKRRDYENIIELIRDKDDLLEPMLDDPRLVERLMNEQEVFVRVSPYLMFSVLLRRVRKDLENQPFVLEPYSRGKRIPVFDAPKTVEFLSDTTLREYLAQMLCSFVKTHTGVVYWKERGMWRKRKFSDMDMDDMIALAQMVDPQFRPRLYKRIADIALFLTGIYPDHTSLFASRPKSMATAARTIPDYEREGRRFYTLAAQQAEPPWPPTVYEELAEKFTVAREALNTLADRYLKPLRERLFDQPVG
ncbi:MAG: hypothetical protein NZ739_09375 [Verrucomicrobiae bacterium]|nr:hypothetical protein [Verrucomicrobiae bacterium]